MPTAWQTQATQIKAKKPSRNAFVIVARSHYYFFLLQPKYTTLTKVTQPYAAVNSKIAADGQVVYQWAVCSGLILLIPVHFRFNSRNFGSARPKKK